MQLTESDVGLSIIHAQKSNSILDTVGLRNTKWEYIMYTKKTIWKVFYDFIDLDVWKLPNYKKTYYLNI